MGGRKQPNAARSPRTEQAVPVRNRSCHRLPSVTIPRLCWVCSLYSSGRVIISPSAPGRWIVAAYRTDHPSAWAEGGLPRDPLGQPVGEGASRPLGRAFQRLARGLDGGVLHSSWGSRFASQVNSLEPALRQVGTGDRERRGTSQTRAIHCPTSMSDQRQKRPRLRSPGTADRAGVRAAAPGCLVMTRTLSIW